MLVEVPLVYSTPVSNGKEADTEVILVEPQNNIVMITAAYNTRVFSTEFTN